MMRRCRACSRHTDDIYEINGWLICFGCVRTPRFWEMLRDSWTAELAAASAPLIGGP